MFFVGVAFLPVHAASNVTTGAPSVNILSGHENGSVTKNWVESINGGAPCPLILKGNDFICEWLTFDNGTVVPGTNVTLTCLTGANYTWTGLCINNELKAELMSDSLTGVISYHVNYNFCIGGQFGSGQDAAVYLCKDYPNATVCNQFNLTVVST